MIGALLTAALHLVWIWIAGETLASFLTMQIVTLLFIGFVGSNFSAIAMEPMGRVAGMASSVQGMMTSLVGVPVGLVIGQSFNGTVVPVIIGSFACAAMGLLIILVTERGRLFRAHPAEILVQ